MKKSVLLSFLMLLCAIVFAQGHIDLRTASESRITQSDFQTLRAVFSYESIASTVVESQRGTFSQIALPSTYPAGNVGSPELPQTHELLAVPVGAMPIVSVVSFTTTDYNLSDYGINTIVPHQASVRKDMDPDKVEFAYDVSAYQTRSLASTPEVSIEVQGTLRGIRVGSLVINPVSYNPSSNTLRVFNDIEVEVSFEGADVEGTKEMLLKTASPYFDIVYKQMFNYGLVRDVYSEHPDLWAAPVRMLVIANDMFSSVLAPWANWKTQKGFYMDINYTSTVGTTASAIRSFIQNKYTTGVQNSETPTFVIIIGDSGQVAPSATGSSSGKVTDLYYGSVDNDYFPDMFYSRMSAETTDQLTAIINKILQYEQYTMPDPSYLNKVLLIAGADGTWNPKVGQPTINYATTYYYNTAHGFSNVYAYLTSYSGCYANLNTGVGFVNYTAHGDNTMWYDPQFTNSNVAALTNTNKYFLAMGNCCLAANWGYSSACFGEAMIRSVDKAAYSYIGSCPSSYWYEDYYFGVGATNTFYSTPSNTESSTGVYDGVWMDDTYNTVSSMVFLGNLAVCYASSGGYNTSVSPLYYWQAYHVLGDGSIMPYRVQPTANTVSHASTFPLGASSFTVNAQPGSYVGITKDNVLLGAALVGTTGSVSVAVTPVTQSGNVKIVVTKPQRQPYSATIPTGTSGDPSIQVQSVTPEEIENGVNQNLTVTMVNVGGGATTGNTTVTISTTDQYLTIVQGTASFGAMAANGGTSTVNNAFTVRAAANTPDGHQFTVTANATYGINTWYSTFVLTGNAPCEAPTGLSATASGNNIHLTWTASSTATSYNVYRGSTQIASNVTGTSYTDSGLSYGTQYCYTVKGNCQGGVLSDPSNQACATTETPCNAPTGLTTSIQGYVNVVLNWDASTYADSYNVLRNNVVIATGLTTTTYTDQNLENGSYCYRVTSVCANGTSDPSSQSCQTIDAPCDAPRNLEAEYVYNGEGDFGVMVEWDAPEGRGLAKYNVYRSANGNVYSIIGEVESSSATHFEYFDEVGHGTYFYQVRALYEWGDATCESDPAHALDIPANNCVMVTVTSVGETANGASIYPNPATDKIEVESNEAITSLKVYNLMGTMTYSATDCGKHVVIDLSSMSSGVYFVQVITSTTNQTRNFVKK